MKTKTINAASAVFQLVIPLIIPSPFQYNTLNSGEKSCSLSLVPVNGIVTNECPIERIIFLISRKSTLVLREKIRVRSFQRSSEHPERQPRDIDEVFPVAGKQGQSVLYRLAGDPQILYAVTMPAAGGLQLCGQAAEDLTGRLIDAQDWLSFQSEQRRVALLPDVGIRGVFSSEFQFRNGEGRDIDRFRAGDPGDIPRGQCPPLHVHPDARIDQESHGSRTVAILSAAPFLLSRTHVVPASSGRVR